VPRVYDVLYTRKQNNPNNRGKKMTKEEIGLEILSLTNKTEIRYLRNVCDEQIRSISNMLKYDLNPGDKVSINSKRMTEDGVIKKVNRTRAVVLIDGKQWNVPFALITKQ